MAARIFRAQKRKGRKGSSWVGLLGFGHFDFAHGVVSPKCQRVLTDKLDLKTPTHFVFLLVIALLKWIGGEAFKKGEYPLPRLN